MMTSVFYDEVHAAWLRAHAQFFNQLVNELNLKELIKRAAEQGGTQLTLNSTTLRRFVDRDKTFADKFYNEFTIKRLKTFLGKGFQFEYVFEPASFFERKCIVIRWG